MKQYPNQTMAFHVDRLQTTVKQNFSFVRSFDENRFVFSFRVVVSTVTPIGLTFRMAELTVKFHRHVVKNR